jgi:antitoxin YefM
MKTVPFSQAQADLQAIMDTVSSEHAPTVISREVGESAVIMSLSEFNGIQETLHLLASPRNAARLMESIEQLKAGKVQPRELIRDEEQESGEQTTGKNERSLMDR